jgi:DNA-binding transcriptional ArsR family regulator
MDSRQEDWLGDSSGPVVRPYALTAGRTRPSGATIDLIALVTAVRRSSLDREQLELEPEHLRLLTLCRLPVSVAELASDLDLPLGVVRILLSDLRERGLISIHQPAQTGLSDVRILQEVADALRKL